MSQFLLEGLHICQMCVSVVGRVTYMSDVCFSGFGTVTYMSDVYLSCFWKAPMYVDFESQIEGTHLWRFSSIPTSNARNITL